MWFRIGATQRRCMALTKVDPTISSCVAWTKVGNLQNWALDPNFPPAWWSKMKLGMQLGPKRTITGPKHPQKIPFYSSTFVLIKFVRAQGYN